MGGRGERVRGRRGNTVWPRAEVIKENATELQNEDGTNHKRNYDGGLTGGCPPDMLREAEPNTEPQAGHKPPTA